QVQGRLRRADPRRGVAFRHLPVHEDRRGRGRHRPRGDGVEDRRGTTLLPHVARPFRGGGVGDDRVRLRRADHEGAAARVRGRDEPADPAPNGGQRRLIVERTDFVSVPVTDVERATGFYRDTLGLEQVSEGGWPEFQLGENISLYLIDPTNLGSSFTGPHTAHIALRVPDVEETRRELEGRGVVFDGE